MTVGDPRLLAISQRTPLARRFGSTIHLSAGAEQLASEDGETWTAAAPAYTGGSWQLCAELDGEMTAYGYGWLDAGSDEGTFTGTWTSYDGPEGALLSSGQFEVTSLPAPTSAGASLWAAHMVWVHEDTVYMSLWRYHLEEVEWRGELTWSWLVSGALVRGTAPGVTDTFEFVSYIAEEDSWPTLTSDALPLFYGADPAIAVPYEGRVVAAVRTSADDDDGYRPLDPEAVFSSSSAGFTDLRSDVRGSYTCSAVYDPPLDADRYYQGEADIPALGVAYSDDGGESWERTLLDEGGLTPMMAYDADADILVLTYAGLVYPRRGHALRYSLDAGETWSDPVHLEEPDGTRLGTSGASAIVSLGEGRFAWNTDHLPAGYVFAGSSEQTDSYRIESRIIEITPGL